MTPSARIQAAIELLDQIIAAARTGGAAADTLIVRYFKERRYAGSKDRRGVRELVYRAIRAYGDAPPSGRAAMIGLARENPDLAALFDGTGHGPAIIAPEETAPDRSLFPAWLAPQLAAHSSDAERAAMLDRAPLHVRVNALKTTVEAARTAFPDATPIDGIPFGLALPEGTALETTTAFQSGHVEIQDAGSQLIALACGARPGMTILDLCAGAGGKTLALAAEMAGDGRLIAADTVRDRLSRLMPRAERAGAAPMIETRLLNPDREVPALADLTDGCDVVLVDAPCSGSGTWRRNPEARWRLTPERIERIAALQRHVLALAAPLVKPGGRLVYAVCSVLDREGRDQAEAFLTRHSGWRIVPADPQRCAHGSGTLLTPHRDGTDGFFFTVLQKP
jgi:16S rRNA (cytosine967-C5)-methyltransferase